MDWHRASVPRHRPRHIGSIAFLAFLIWLWLLRNYHGSPIGFLSFMTPIFGVLLGAWLLSESLETSFLERDTSKAKLFSHSDK